MQPVRLSAWEDEPLGKEAPLYCETDFCLAVVVYVTWFGRFYKLDLAKDNWLLVQPTASSRCSPGESMACCVAGSLSEMMLVCLKV